MSKVNLIEYNYHKQKSRQLVKCTSGGNPINVIRHNYSFFYLDRLVQGSTWSLLSVGKVNSYITNAVVNDACELDSTPRA